jgi:DNA-binding XRE family transcriptional regulator
VYGQVSGLCLGSGPTPSYDFRVNALLFEPTNEMQSLLKGLRRRVDPQTPKLGERERLNTRLGKSVSQEELAEAMGVSLGWYASLERGAARPSVSLLKRLTIALNASREERITLLKLAIPELAELF